MKIPYKLQLSEKLRPDSIEHLKSQNFQLKLFKSKKFDGYFKKNILNIDYHPINTRRLTTGTITITGKLENHELTLKYKLANGYIFLFAFANLLVFIAYLNDTFKIIDFSNSGTPYWIPIVYPLASYILLIIIFRYHIGNCQRRLKIFLSEKMNS